MDRQEIYKLIEAAKSVIAQAKTNDNGKPTTTPNQTTIASYYKVATRLFGVNSTTRIIRLPSSTKEITEKVRESRTKSTLQIYARSVRFVAVDMLKLLLKKIDHAQRDKDWILVESIITSPKFKTIVELSSMLPAEYSDGWVPKRKRKGKKASLSRLPHDWREQMARHSSGQYHVPMLVSLLTGCRPVELAKGVKITRKKDTLRVRVEGAKITQHAGQEFREFNLADYPLTNQLLALFDPAESVKIVKVDTPNSVTTHMRSVGLKLWPKRKESITCYTARHAMAAECKRAIANGSNPDLVSKVLGHVVDKTASYYGNRFQASGISVVPSLVLVPHPIRQKVRARNALRKETRKNVVNPKGPRI